MTSKIKNSTALYKNFFMLELEIDETASVKDSTGQD